jgi:HD-GYP domain-containing protein (c-di-GMP phosphodiesterase class II)
LRAVLEHHEQLDGQGYPNRIAGAEFSADGQLLRLADVYCARMSFREYRSAVPLTVALRDILQDKGKTVEPALAAQFIRAMGIFPPGLKLRLANGEIGVVVRAGESPNHPVVVVLVAANGEAMAQGVYRDTRNPAYAVGDTVNPATFKAYVDIAAIWGS